MSTAVPELIAEEIVDRLLNITTLNGYSFNVSEVVRPDRGGVTWKRQHLGIGVLQGDSDRNNELYRPGNPPAVAYDQTYSLCCVIRDSDTSTAAHATNENEFYAAVMLALVDSNQATWHTMGSLAIDTRVEAPSPFISPEGESNGITVNVIVTYRVSETDPYTVRA